MAKGSPKKDSKLNAGWMTAEIRQIEIDFIEAARGRSGSIEYRLMTLTEKLKIRVKRRRIPESHVSFKRDHPGPTVFIMMTLPRKKPKTIREDRKLDKLYSCLKGSLVRYGLEAIRADEKNYSKSGSLWDNVCIYMEESDFGIAVMENLFEDEWNANVAVEYGYMNALVKKTFLLKEKKFTRIPTDMIGILWKEFDIDDPKSVEMAIDQWMSEIGRPRLGVE